jgi:hypothetical protein
MNDEMGASDTKQASSGTILERAAKNVVTTHHLVFKLTLVHGDVKYSITAATLNLAKVTPHILNSMVHTLLVTTYNYGLAVCIICADGAMDNVKFFDGATTEPMIGDYVSQELKGTFADRLNFSQHFVMTHPISDESICCHRRYATHGETNCECNRVLVEPKHEATAQRGGQEPA